MRITNRNAFLDESLDAARTFIKEHREQIGSAHALLLNRHLNFVAGTPDISQSILNGVSKTAIDGINNMVDKINLKSPVKIPKIEWTAQEGWGRYMLYSYAAGLGYNIGAVVRDAHQILVTTGPVLGPKYMQKGFAAIEGSWPQIKKRWDFVQKHGGLLEYSELSTLYSGGYEHLQRTRLTKLAERSLKTYQGVNNASRFVSWWGHWKKMQDATRDYYKHRNVQKWLDDSAVGWLDDSQIEKYVKTLQSGSLKQVDDMLPHAATDLSNFSQWNYTRGAHPGLYKFAVGRLLGQYGTWPMNYVEFLKRLTTGGQVSKQARTKALLQMAASHYGMFAGYGAMGIDTASWVFLSPAGYSFSPLFNAGVNVLPAASNWYDDRGDEARKKVLAPLYPMAIPAGNQGKRLLESLFGDSKNPALDILGMKSMDEADTNRMMYSINPGADNDR